MNEFVLYLFRSVCWLSGFALIYFLFLKNERFFNLKRIYLVTGILASLIFPLISFHYPVEVPAPVTLAFDPGQNVLTWHSGIGQETQPNKIDLMNLLLIIYLTGMVLIAATKGWHIFQIFNAISGNNIYRINSAKIVRASEFRSSFSFFNYVFINPSVADNEVKEIMNHELVHVNQKHWFDLLLGELLKLIQWANPFAWIYTGFIRLNHEYLADKVALQCTSNPANYKVALLNQMYRTPVISLSNPFNYTVNKNRFEMMKKIVTSPFRKLEVLLIIPVSAIIFYAFAQPEIRYTGQEVNTITVIDLPVDGNVKGTILKEDGKPFSDVQIAVTGTEIRGTTDASGNFDLAGIPEDSHLVFSYRGYITQVLKPRFSGAMAVKLLKDPDYPGIRISSTYRNALVVIDGVLSEKPQIQALNDIDENQIARMSVLPYKEATAKYSEKGKNGVVEITTRKKAAELGMKYPFRRTNPEDYPTFYGESYLKFNAWLADNIKYPSDAASRGIEGRVTVNFVIQPDGSLTNPTIMSSHDQSISDAVIKAVKESPRWDPAKNQQVQDPFATTATVKFSLPGKITPDDTYVMVEQAPEYPGGDKALLDFIKSNQRYPAGAIADKAEGRVIVRFIVNTKGMVEGAEVLKGVHPLLDAEALRVVNSLSGWLPGAQGGKPVNVWYMVPVNFSLTPEVKGTTAPTPSVPAPFENPEEMPQFPGGPGAMSMTIVERMQYPEEARNQKIQGRVVVRFIVTAEGKVRNPIVTKGVHPLLDEEAVRVVSALPDFKPGMQAGKPVDAYFTVPITFMTK